MLQSEIVQLNQEVLQNIQISSQEYMIIKTLESFYDNEENSNLLWPIINSDSDISIRLIDHFVTKYAKHNKICYKITENNTEQIINIYTSYKQQLKAFQKKHFDPFSRGDRIPYFIKNNCIITTIGQLNFFKWFFTKKVYNYIRNNKEIIENDMNKKNKLGKKHFDDKIKKKIKNNNINNKLYIKNNNIIENKTDKIVVSFSFN
jgi:hypothetical protein